MHENVQVLTSKCILIGCVNQNGNGFILANPVHTILLPKPHHFLLARHISNQTRYRYNTVVLHNSFPYLLHNRSSEPALSNQNPLLVSVHLWINSCWLDHRSPHHQEENITDLLINSSFNNMIIDWRNNRIL